MPNTSAEFSTILGQELEIFQYADVWKRYWGAKITPFLGHTVIEVGAGIGANAERLHQKVGEWICLEPEEEFYTILESRIIKGDLPESCKAIHGILKDLPSDIVADTILYIDVLEHIEKDQEELTKAAQLLKEGGYLVVLAPAHPFLFSPFDAAIGHYRRYTKTSLATLTPPSYKLVQARYLDSVGLLASSFNRYVMKSAAPNQKQILFWDRALVRLSRFLDPLTGYTLGKTILCVWQKTNLAGH